MRKNNHLFRLVHTLFSMFPGIFCTFQIISDSYWSEDLNQQWLSHTYEPLISINPLTCHSSTNTTFRCGRIRDLCSTSHFSDFALSFDVGKFFVLIAGRHVAVGMVMTVVEVGSVIEVLRMMRRVERVVSVLLDSGWGKKNGKYEEVYWENNDRK